MGIDSMRSLIGMIGDISDTHWWCEPVGLTGCRRESVCRMPACGTPRRRFVYGLWDAQIDNVFYVGSAFDLFKRFTEHLRENEYVLLMLERGSFPIQLVFLEFTTSCHTYSCGVERQIAQQLRSQGHYAFGDDIWCRRYADLVDDQARQLAFLREIWAA